ELMPEILQIPVILGPDHTKARERRVRRPDAAGELITLVIERNEQHVVDGEQRPDQQGDAKHSAHDAAGNSPSVAVPRARAAISSGHAAHADFIGESRGHSCTPVLCKRRIKRITAGMASGRTDIIAAVPSSGWPKVKAWRKP